MAFWGILGVFSFLDLFFASGHLEVSNFASSCVPAMVFFLSRGRKITGNFMDWHLLNHGPKWNILLISCYCQAFCHTTASWLTNCPKHRQHLCPLNVKARRNHMGSLLLPGTWQWIRNSDKWIYVSEPKGDKWESILHCVLIFPH